MQSEGISGETIHEVSVEVASTPGDLSATVSNIQRMPSLLSAPTLTRTPKTQSREYTMLEEPVPITDGERQDILVVNGGTDRPDAVSESSSVLITEVAPEVAEQIALRLKESEEVVSAGNVTSLTEEEEDYDTDLEDEGKFSCLQI